MGRWTSSLLVVLLFSNKSEMACEMSYAQGFNYQCSFIKTDVWSPQFQCTKLLSYYILSIEQVLYSGLWANVLCTLLILHAPLCLLSSCMCALLVPIFIRILCLCVCDSYHTFSVVRSAIHSRKLPVLFHYSVDKSEYFASIGVFFHGWIPYLAFRSLPVWWRYLKLSQAVLCCTNASFIASSILD